MPLLTSLFLATMALEFRIAGPSNSVAIVKVGPFEKAKHALAVKPIVDEGAPMTFVDGKFAWGCGGGPPMEVPENEIKSITIRTGGKAVNLPKKLLDDLFDIGAAERFELTKGSSPGVVKLHMDGSDGYAGYAVEWTVRRDGHCTRIVNPGP